MTKEGCHSEQHPVQPFDDGCLGDSPLEGTGFELSVPLARRLSMNGRSGPVRVPAAQTVCLRASCCSPFLISSSALVRFSTIL